MPRRIVWFVVAGAALSALAAALLLPWAGFWAASLETGHVRPLAAGDQEIAWLAPATGGESWERLVKALRLLADECRNVHGTDDLRLDADRAFLPLTADVPEVGLSFPGAGTLWVRWYKLSGSTSAEHWMRGLKRRGAPPLAIVGGETTDRAVTLAGTLERVKASWAGPAPLFLITTATAERYRPANRPDLEADHDRWPRLMEAYPERTFRFCFTNARMVEAVFGFVQSHPQIWPRHARSPTVDPKSPFFLFTLTWLDDGYSKDLASTFQHTYAQYIRGVAGADAVVPADEQFIAYSVGDFYRPNPREEIAVTLYLDQVRTPDELPPLGMPTLLPSYLGVLAAARQLEVADRRQLLVVPVGTQPARRFLHTLCSRAPKEVRNMVVVNGDAISFNSVYRDRDIVWNVQDVPLPLVFFAHRNPIDAAAGFGARRQDMTDRSSTSDLLLFRDIFEALVLASFDGGQLAADADVLRSRLRRACWKDGRVFLGDGGPPLFDAAGDRTPLTGEHVVALSPHFETARVLPEAELTVWQPRKETWERIGVLPLTYDRRRQPESVHESP
jgi:hypothetical protein